jgi:hypothetical protein
LQQLKSSKRFISDEYDLISWVMRIFVGGLFSTVPIAAFVAVYIANVPIIGGSYDLEYASLSTNLTLLALIIITVVSPFMFSLVLSKLRPTLRIVSPFYITMVTFGFVTAIWGLTSVGNFFLSILIGGMLVAVGYIEDIPSTAILGKGTDRANIYFEQLSVYADLEEVKKRLSIPEIRKGLILCEKAEGTDEQGYTFLTLKVIHIRI